MNPNPLVSVIILSYKNYRFIYQALDSVLSQDYKNIEIIISNDGSTDFDKAATIKFLKKYKSQNQPTVIFNNNNKNLGTVKNINKAIKLSHGKYIVLFSADDAVYNNKVISKFINIFEKLPENELIVTSQVNMCDINLKNLIQPFISKNDIQNIRKLTPQKLFAEMSSRCIIPGLGTCYKREIFNKYHIFNEKYVLVEDYSSALKLTRMGVKYNFGDFISFKHRDGGISHGNVNGESQKSNQYELDIINILKHEVLPYINQLNKKQKKIFLQTYHDYIFRFEYKYHFKNGSKSQRRAYIRNNFNVFLISLYRTITQEIANQLVGKKIKLFIIGAVLFSLYCLNIKYSKNIILFSALNFSSNYINLYIGLIGIVLILASTLSMIIYLFKKYYFNISNFIKLIF